MRHVIPFVILVLIGLVGCQRAQTQAQIEGDVKFAISRGESPEDIEQLIRQADDPSQAAVAGLWEIMTLGNMPDKIEQTWVHSQTEELISDNYFYRSTTIRITG